MKPLALFIIAVWMTPLLWELVSVGQLATPASVLIMVGTMALTARVALKIHSSLEETFEHTFLGSQPVGPVGPVGAEAVVNDSGDPASPVEHVPQVAPIGQVAPAREAPEFEKTLLPLDGGGRGASISGREWQRGLKAREVRLRR